MSLMGSCQCGEIKYRVSYDAQRAYYCHCRMCQKAMGNLFATFFCVDKEVVKWLKKKPKYYKSSKKARRGFCAKCGTPLTFEYFDGEKIDLTVGSLDKPGKLKPVGHTGIESRVKHFEWKDPLPKYKTGRKK